MTVVSFSAEKGGPVGNRCGVSAEGVFIVSAGDVVFDPPRRVLKLPAKEGDTWDVVEPTKPGEFPRKVKYTTGKEEEVETPAGKFKAVRVEQEDIQGGVVFRTSIWYGRGVGVVKVVTHLEEGDRTRLELRSITPAKK
jgi:hypothetical protein